MFFLKTLKKDIIIQPRHFGPRLNETIKQVLMNEVEGTFDPMLGCIATVIDVERIGKGRLRQSLGDAVFSIRYKALIFRPVKGEVLDCVVTTVGPVGVQAAAGPLQIFVSTQCMHSDMRFDNQGPEAMYISSDNLMQIKKETELRVKIFGLNLSSTGMTAVGTICEHYLGVISE